MKTRIVTACFLVALALPGLAQTPDTSATPAPAAQKKKASDYRYYKVTDKDTVDTICLLNNCDSKTLLQLNPELKLRNPQEVGVVFVPVPPPPPPRKRKPRPVQVEQGGKIEANTPDDMTQDEIAYLIETSVGKNASRSSSPVGANIIPEHRNVFYGSDGRAVYVPSAPPPAPPPDRSGDKDHRRGLSSRRGRAIGGLLGTARKYMGVPYVWGGEDPSGFDCSGFLQHVYARHGIALPRTADLQFNVGQVVPRGKEQPGDMIFFETYCPGPSHCGIYIGKGYFIHASSSRGVTISNLSEDFFASRYLGAKRVIGANKR